MVLSCQHISLSFGTDLILEDISFNIEEHEKAAIIGINGAGKSTLLKIITGELEADSGSVVTAKGKTIGYLSQHQDVNSDATVYDELMSVRKDIIEIYDKLRDIEKRMQDAGEDELEDLYRTYDRLNQIFEDANGYAVKSEVTGVLKGLGFTEDEFGFSINTLSGGQKTRVFLGKLLLTKPDIIMLDEPTNHLDMNAIRWLEGFLVNYPGAVLIVAHDRYFLDNVVTKVIEIENRHSLVFMGNYTAFSEKKERLREDKLKAYMNQQRELKHQEEVITKLRSFNREKSIKRAESREKMLEKTEVLEKPESVNAYMKLTLKPAVVSGNDVLHVEGLKKAFGDNLLFDGLDIDIKRGEKVAIIGDNGTGKTTILKMINGIIPPDRGIIKLGSNVHIGYYDQEQHVLDMNKTIFDEISDTWPDMNNTRIRNVLASFLFTGDDVYKYIRDLSGGERGRVSLAKLMLSDANFIILDEPTNHLDIMSKEILEKAISSYSGTVLFVSHDRYFINKTAERILDLTNKHLISYGGNYNYYLEKKENIRLPGAEDAYANVDEKQIKKESSRDSYNEKKRRQADKRKLENDLKKVMDRIDQIDSRKEELDLLLSSEEVYTNASKLLEINKEREALDEEQLILMEKWEELELKQTNND